MISCSTFNCCDSLKNYKCRNCIFATNERISGLIHVCGFASREEPMLYSCRKCKLKTNSSLLFCGHQQNCRKKIPHLKNKCFQCDHCTHKSRAKSDLKRHILNRHTPLSSILKWHKCAKCDYKAKIRGDLNKHMMYRHSICDKRYKCDQCSYQTHQKKPLKLHKIRKHTINDLIEWHHCDQCSNRKFKIYDDLKQHQLYQHILQDKKFKCGACLYETKYKSDLRKHERAKHNSDAFNHDKKHKCEQCSYKTNIRQHLKDHNVLKHTPHNQIEWLFCGICNQKCKTEIILKKHVANRHSQSGKRFKCDHCTYETYTTYHLKQHITNKHVPDELINWYQCDYCAKKFKVENFLKRHVKSKHL